MTPSQADFDEVCAAFVSWAGLYAEGHVDDAVQAVDDYLGAVPDQCRCVGPAIVASQFVARAVRNHAPTWRFCQPDTLPLEAAVMEAAVRSFLADDPVAAAARIVMLHNAHGCVAARGVILAAVALYVEVCSRAAALNVRSPRFPNRPWPNRRRIFDRDR